MSHQYKTIGDTVYMGFGSNDTSGSGDDGSTPVFDVRLAGDFASGIPVYSAAATLLTHANYSDGSHEVAIPATAANGFLSSGTYLVYVSLLVDSQNPTGFLGSFELNPVLSNVTEINSVEQRAADLAEFSQYIFANAATLTDIIANDSVQAQAMATSGLIANYSKVDDAQQSIRDAITAASPQEHSATANNETGNTTLDGGTYADTATDDVNYYQTGPGVAVGGFGLNCDLTFNIGVGRVSAQVTVKGYFDSGAQRTVQVWAYDYIAAGYVQLSNSTNDFGNSGSDESFPYSMTNNMRQVSDGEVKIRFTSESETVTDVWNCNYINLTSIEQAGAGLTSDAIQAAVWARAASGHDEMTLGYNLSKIHVLQGDIVSATNANQFIIDAGLAVNDTYNGMLIMVEDKDDDHYEVRRVVDYIGATNEIFLDRDLGFVPVANDDYYILSTGYADVNTTHVSGTAQTANDNGADINTLVSRVTDNVATAAKLLAYIQLITRSDAAINTDNSTELTEINADGGSGGGDFDNQTDSEEAIRDVAPHGTAMRGTDSAALATKLLAYIQLISRSDAAINTDNGTELTEINADEGSGAGNFDNQTDSEEAIRDVEPHGTAMRGTDSAALASVLGALADSAADGDPTSVDTIMQYMKQLINILIGTTGIVNFPAEAAPSNNVSLAEVIRGIYVDVTGLNGDAMRGTDIGDLNDFDPDNDDVAKVTLTDTATEVTNRVTANMDQIAGIAAAATKLAASAGTVVSAAASTGTLSLTQMTTNLTEVTDDHYKGRIIIWTSGVLQNQATDITAYEGATKMLTFTGVTEAPSNNDTFVIV